MCCCFRSKDMRCQIRTGRLAVVILTTLCAGALAGPSAGQSAGQSAGHNQRNPQLGKAGAKPMPLHRPLLVFTPQDAFRLLARGNRRFLDSKRSAGGRSRKPGPLRRPAGAGRHVAAVVQGIGHRHRATDLFGIAHPDLLELASPGPCIRSAEVSALEDAVRDHRLGLLVILVRPQDPALKGPGPNATKARRVLWSHVRTAHRLATAARISLAEAHGLTQAEVLWRLSPYLRQQRRLERFRIAVGIVKPRIGAVRWVNRWHQVPPLVAPSAGR